MNISRRKKILLNSGMNGVAQAVHITATLVTIPVLLNYLGKDGLGLWMIALSFIAMVSFAQGGLSSALINIASSSPDNDHLSSQSASAFVLTALLFIVLLPVAALISWSVPWLALFDVASEGHFQNISALFFVLLAGLGFSFVANVPKFIIIGRLDGFAAYAIDALSAVIAAIALIAAAWTSQPLWVLALAFSFGRYIPMLLFGSLYCLLGLKLRIWQLHRANWSSAQSQLGAGGLLTVNHIAYSVSSHSDLLIIGTFSDLDGAGDYGIVQRVFSIPVMLVQFLNMALWPEFSRAHAAGEGHWIIRTFARTAAASVIASIVFAVVIFYALDGILYLWLGAGNEQTGALVWGMAVWATMIAIISTCSNLVKSIGRLRVLSLLHILMMVVNLPISIILVREIGAAGAIWGTVISYILCFIIPYAFIIPRILIELRQSAHARELRHADTAIN